MPLPWKKKCNPMIDEVSRSDNSNFDSQKYDPVFAEIGCDDRVVLNFNREIDVAFCVGVDILTDSVCVEQEKLETIAKDARDTREVFITTLGLKDTRVKLSMASNLNDDCTKEGLRTSFFESAKQVGEKGNFIFYFAGHGNELRDRCILAPTNFAKNEKTGISGDDLVQWLNDADCKASNVLFIFDCCFAGSLGASLTHSEELTIAAHLFVMCGCMPREKVTSVSALKHSVFSYCLLDYLETCDSGREFKIQQAMDEISNLCFGLSNLILIYKEGKLHCAGFNPGLYQRRAFVIQEQLVNESTPRKPINSTLTLLLENPIYYRPHDMVDQWLQIPAIKKSLKILHYKASLSNNKNLQNCIVSLLLHSSALIHYEYCKADKKENGLEKKNIFLQIAIKVSNEVTFCNLTIDHVMIGLEHYISAVKSLGIDCSNLLKLADNMQDVN